MLPDAGDHRGERHGDVLHHRGPASGRVPIEETLVLERGHRRIRGGPSHEVCSVVVVGVRFASVGLITHAGRSVAADRRGDDADVNVLDRHEVDHAGGAAPIGVALAHLRPRSRIDAHRIDEPTDQIRDRQRDDLLLVGHRRRVVEHDEQIDLHRPGVLRRGRRHAGRRSRTRATCATCATFATRPGSSACATTAIDAVACARCSRAAMATLEEAPPEPPPLPATPPSRPASPSAPPEPCVPVAVCSGPPHAMSAKLPGNPGS